MFCQKAMPYYGVRTTVDCDQKTTTGIPSTNKTSTSQVYIIYNILLLYIYIYLYISCLYVQHIDVDMYYMDFQVLNSHFDILSGQVSVKKDLTPFLEKCSAKRTDEAQKWCRCICGSPERRRKSPHHVALKRTEIWISVPLKWRVVFE